MNDLQLARWHTGRIDHHSKLRPAISVTAELASGRTITADLADISLSALSLRLATPAEPHELSGSWLVRFPNLPPNADSLRLRVTSSRSDCLGTYVDLSPTPSHDERENEKSRELLRAAINMHESQHAAMARESGPGEQAKITTLWEQRAGTGPASARNDMTACLEYCPTEGEQTRRIPVNALPFRIGRSSGCHFVIASSEVSKEHAEITCLDGQYRVRDLGSTNGTFVNGFRVSDAPLSDGDTLEVAHVEFRFVANAEQLVAEAIPNTVPLSGKLPLNTGRGKQHLQEMMQNGWVRTLFEPIVHLETRQVLGYEASARGLHNELSAAPEELLQLAERCKIAVELSRFFRSAAVRAAFELPSDQLLFLQLDCSEPTREDFAQSLAELRYTKRPLVFELPEQLTRYRTIMRQLHEQIKALDIQIAYGAFEVGQSHFLELATLNPEELPALRRVHEEMKNRGLPIESEDFRTAQFRFFELADLRPQFMKLDLRVLREVSGGEALRDVLGSFTHACVELGIQIIADGVETSKEADDCRQLGCRFGQGSFFGLPKVATEIKVAREKTGYFIVAELRSRLRPRV